MYFATCQVMGSFQNIFGTFRRPLGRNDCKGKSPYLEGKRVLQEIFNASFNKDQIYTRCPTPVQDRPHPYPLLIIRKEERADGPRPAATAIQADNLPLSLAASKPGPGQRKKTTPLISIILHRPPPQRHPRRPPTQPPPTETKCKKATTSISPLFFAIF